jgi:hypothetical protein
MVANFVFFIFYIWLIRGAVMAVTTAISIDVRCSEAILATSAR